MTAFRSLIPLVLVAFIFGIGALYSPPEDLMLDALPTAGPVQWHLPRSTARVPVVLLLEEPNQAGGNAWIGWFLRHGMAVAQIRGDLAVGAELTRRQPRIDAEHFAVMGIGRQAVAALNAADAFAGGPMPTAVFALDPPCSGPCPHSFPPAGPTRVYILQGDGHDRLGVEIARSTVLATLALAWQIED